MCTTPEIPYRCPSVFQEKTSFISFLIKVRRMSAELFLWTWWRVKYVSCRNAIDTAPSPSLSHLETFRLLITRSTVKADCDTAKTSDFTEGYDKDSALVAYSTTIQIMQGVLLFHYMWQNVVSICGTSANKLDHYCTQLITWLIFVDFHKSCVSVKTRQNFKS